MKQVVLILSVIMTMYSAHAESSYGRLLDYALCANALEDEMPICDAIGTRSEGWYLDGQLMIDYRGVPAFDKCQFKKVECKAIGTRSEGWYVSPILFGHTKSMTIGQCSDMCTEMATTQCKDVQGEILYGTCYVSAFAGCMSGCE
jgi:hypothetical protein